MTQQNGIFETKSRIYKTIILLIMTYTRKIWNKKVHGTMKIEVMRRIAGNIILDNERNKDIQNNRPYKLRSVGFPRKMWCYNLNTEQLDENSKSYLRLTYRRNTKKTIQSSIKFNTFLLRNKAQILKNTFSYCHPFSTCLYTCFNQYY